MTIKEAIIDSLRKIHIEETRDEDTGEVLEKEHDIFPMCFPYMLQSISAILVYMADQALKIDFPDVTVEGTRESGKAPKKITVENYIAVLTGTDFVSIMRGMNLHLQLDGFIEWWLEQDAETEDIEKMWYYHDSIAEKWNKYAAIRRAEK